MRRSDAWSDLMISSVGIALFSATILVCSIEFRSPVELMERGIEALRAANEIASKIEDFAYSPLDKMEIDLDQNVSVGDGWVMVDVDGVKKFAHLRIRVQPMSSEIGGKLVLERGNGTIIIR